MRIVIVGNRKLARHLFTHLIEEGYDVVGALVPKGGLANEQANFVPFEEIALEVGCPLHGTADINSTETITWLRKREPDLCICGGWSQIIGEKVLDVPTRHFLGFHSSPLPKGRGGAPVNWSIISGERSVGLSLFCYVGAVDAGDIAAQTSVPVKERDDVQTVFDALSAEACRLASTVCEDLRSNEIELEPQSLKEATYRPRRQPQDGLIDWNSDPDEQFDWVRAQTDPYPGAYTFYGQERITVWSGEPIETSHQDAKPGEVLRVVEDEGIDVRTGNGSFRLSRVQKGNRPPCWADELAEREAISSGDRFDFEFAPDDWLYTSIQGPSDPTNFETNLRVGDTSSVKAVILTGSERELELIASIDGQQLLKDSVTVNGRYSKLIEYSPSEPGTHTMKITFKEGDATSDVRYLKIYAH